MSTELFRDRGTRRVEVARYSQGYASLFAVASFCSIVGCSVFVEALAYEETFLFKKTDWGFFFPYYILILQNRKLLHFNCILFKHLCWSSKKYASLNFSNYRNIYVTIFCFKKKYLCACVYNIYIHIYLYTYNLCFPVECIFMRFLTRTKTNSIPYQYFWSLTNFWTRNLVLPAV